MKLSLSLNNKKYENTLVYNKTNYSFQPTFYYNVEKKTPIEINLDKIEQINGSVLFDNCILIDFDSDLYYLDVLKKFAIYGTRNSRLLFDYHNGDYNDYLIPVKLEYENITHY